jgi:hypothetical protein
VRSTFLSAAFVALLAAGCSFILNPADPEQCSAKSDCDANPSFRGRVCEQGFCVVPKAKVGPVSNDAGAGCLTTAGCTAQNSNQPSVCKVAGGPCTPWKVELCPYVSGAWDDPDAIVIGTLLPLHTRQINGELVEIPYAHRVRRAMELALAEINDAQPSGLLYGSKKHKLAAVHCDSHFEPIAAKQAMTHLVDVVGAPIVIVGSDDDLLTVLPQAAAKNTALVCSDCIGPFPAENTAWRILPQLSLQAPLASWRVADLEAQIKAQPSPPAAIKVAVLTQPGSAERAFLEELEATLVFNGKGPAANGSSFTVIQEEDARTKEVQFQQHAQELADFEPDIVVVAMGPDFANYYLGLVEQAWHVAKARPYWIITDVDFDVTPFVSTIGTRDGDALRARISGTRNVYEQAFQDNIDSFTSRYLPPNNYNAPDGNFSGYDAFYAAMFAIGGASTQGILDGAHISAGFERLLAGNQPTDFRPANISLGLASLTQPGATIDVRGLWSDLAWDLTTHDMVTDSSMFCFQLRPDGQLVVKPNAGPRYVRSTKTVTGTFSCD